MDLKTIKEKVDEIAKAKNIHDQEVYNRIIAFLDVTYNYSVPEKEEQQIIIQIKNKILKTLYLKDRHKQPVNPHINLNQLFGLDGIEMKYFDRAITELEADGQVSILKFEISLTDKGIMMARSL